MEVFWLKAPLCCTGISRPSFVQPPGWDRVHSRPVRHSLGAHHVRSRISPAQHISPVGQAPVRQLFFSPVCCFGNTLSTQGSAPICRVQRLHSTLQWSTDYRHREVGPNFFLIFIHVFKAVVWYTVHTVYVLRRTSSMSIQKGKGVSLLGFRTNGVHTMSFSVLLFV